MEGCLRTDAIKGRAHIGTVLALGLRCGMVEIPDNRSSSSVRPGTPRRRLFIKTYGCQMNVYDSEKLGRILEDRYELHDDPASADLILINTCSVRDKPEHKLYSMLGQLEIEKRERPNLMVGVGGCVAQQEGEKIVRRSRVVDFVFGTHNLSLVPSLIDRRQAGFGPQVAVNYRDEWEELPLGFPQSRVSTFISISRGCNKNCTYCIVPTTRGPEVSRPLAEIEREVKLAVHRGTREIVLLGQTVNSYGLDLSPRVKFSELLELVSGIEGVERIRFTSPHPQEIKDDFIRLIGSNPKICRHVHLPLQSGSDRILKLMNRNYRRERYLEIVRALREVAPEVAITTDLITGFPGETEDDFAQSLDLLEQVRFTSSYSFAFSPRPGTVAATMADQIPRDVALDRVYRFQARQDQIEDEYLRSWFGRRAEVLIDGPSHYGAGELEGRISQNITVNFPGEVGNIAPNLAPGMKASVEILDKSRHTLQGRFRP